LATSSPEFKASIRVLGLIEQDYLEWLYQQADYVLLPSTYEGFGLPLTEAVARGVPVFCSDIPPFREQIETYDLDKYVTIVPGVDAVSWAAAIRELLNEMPIKTVSLTAIHERLSKWKWSDVASAYKRIMQKSAC
jgi:glycosyltransferase involved in cell wall biosynthesis